MKFDIVWEDCIDQEEDRVVLRPRNLQATTVRDSPQSTFPTSPWLFGMGNPFGLWSNYHRSSKKIKRFYQLQPDPLYIFWYFLLKVWNARAYLTMQDDKGCQEYSQRDVQVLTSRLSIHKHLNHIQQRIKTNYLTYP